LKQQENYSELTDVDENGEQPRKKRRTVASTAVKKSKGKGKRRN